MAPERAYLWFKRSCWLLATFLLATMACLVFDWPSHWIAVVASFTFAEVTRRIAAESRPEVSLRWRDVLGHLFDRGR
ncbi:hypothetical protein [Halomonas sp. I5-271120]|uniref:hypothetical protein n=1 Tax=Halomonas sp. I5-271120 TaxID=3061632 RepID=UPI0027155C98|nr:hypothetical protein [Halomonas sp. I5-271120]